MTLNGSLIFRSANLGLWMNLPDKVELMNPSIASTQLTKDSLSSAFDTKYLFFTGKGGVGKTSIASATALAFAEQGLRVLLVSTDPASNLDETFGVELSNRPTRIPFHPFLSAMNINPESAAEDYRQRVIAPLKDSASAEEISGLKEQLSGACTVEIAAFDEFTALLSDDAQSRSFDKIIFDTAPTGHTLRLLSLPKAWTSFFDMNERGASCLGPHSALKNQADRFEMALSALRDPRLTTVVLVARPELSTLNEADKTARELNALELSQQVLIINGIFVPASSSDALAQSLGKKSRQCFEQLPPTLCKLPLYFVPLKSFNTVGLNALRQLLDAHARPKQEEAVVVTGHFGNSANFDLKDLAVELANQGHGLVMVMGKGGVGKTTVATAIAVAVAKLGKTVHLTTTDPAAHLVQTLDGSLAHLQISRIDPAAETKAYVDKILAAKSPKLDAEGIALLKEDLASPCTEEVAVFHAFSRVVFESRRSIVIVDTAPTGHTLLLLDAAGSYHREMLKKFEDSTPGKMTTTLMMLQDPNQSKILLVALAETTPVSEAAVLQEDLRRAKIEPYAWVVNRCLAASETHDPLLKMRAIHEQDQLARIRQGLATKLAILPYMPEDPVGLRLLGKLIP
jgi:arsenite-transporting ATPase